MCMSVKNQKKRPHSGALSRGKNLLKYVVRCIIIQIHSFVDFLVDRCFGFFYNRSSRKVRPISNSLVVCSAVDLAEKIRTKQCSCVEVITAFIERCKEVNAVINAIVEERYEDALNDAREVDKLLERNVDVESIERDKPFLGVPFTTKESNEANGMLHTMGIARRRNCRSTEDATVIQFVKQSGAILLAKTNIPELNLWCESRNNLYGTTCNPYDTSRTVGGSSGGEAAIIAACGAAFSVASDIGGSTRMPAFFNGVFGFKPTEGLTALRGIGLRKTDYPNSMAEAGPICKYSADLSPLLKVFLSKKSSLLSLDTPVDLKSIQIFYQSQSGDLRASKISLPLRKALSKSVDHLKQLTGGATKIVIPGTEYSYRLWRYWMTQESFDFKLAITDGTYRASAVSEIGKMITGRSEITLAAIIKLIDEDLLPPENEEWARKVTDEMKKYLLHKLGENGVLLYPSSPFSAGYHYTAYLRPFNFGYWCLFNVLRLPVCQVPLGLDEEGLPLGIQVVASPYKDHLCIAVAKELESAFGGWVPPS